MPNEDQERPTAATLPPQRLRRVGRRGVTWGLTRHLTGFRPALPVDRSIAGAAPKWLLENAEAKETLIAKLGAKNGRIEVLTELFNCRLGRALGFEMAECGLARLDDNLYFLSRYFLKDDERLVHGSLMIEDIMQAPRETDRVPKRAREEQAFYSLDFLSDVFERFCGADATAAFNGFIQMLVFDALIGSMDRHAQNWGVITSLSQDRHVIRFAPIFDSAHTLLWDRPSAKLKIQSWGEGDLRRYVQNARPCIGPPVLPTRPRRRHCNHFDLLSALLERWPDGTKRGLERLNVSVEEVARKLLNDFPFNRSFCGRRRRLIIQILGLRQAEILKVAEEGRPRNEIVSYAF